MSALMYEDSFSYLYLPLWPLFLPPVGYFLVICDNDVETQSRDLFAWFLQETGTAIQAPLRHPDIF